MLKLDSFIIKNCRVKYYSKNGNCTEVILVFFFVFEGVLEVWETREHDDLFQGNKKYPLN